MLRALVTAPPRADASGGEGAFGGRFHGEDGHTILGDFDAKFINGSFVGTFGARKTEDTP